MTGLVLAGLACGLVSLAGVVVLLAGELRWQQRGAACSR